MAKQKAPCPVSKSKFLEKATPLNVAIDGQPFVAEVKEFSTGSFGWMLNGGKITATIDGKQVTASVGLNLIVHGSKEAAQ